jgi:hypothetical protein
MQNSNAAMLLLLLVVCARLRTLAADFFEAGRGPSSFARPKLDQVPAAQRCFPSARFPLGYCQLNFQG